MKIHQLGFCLSLALSLPGVIDAQEPEHGHQIDPGHDDSDSPAHTPQAAPAPAPARNKSSRTTLPQQGTQALDPKAALRQLQNGNLRFAAGTSIGKAIGEGVRRSLAQGQRPYAIVLTTSDSRTAPEHIFNAGLGELYVLRTVGHQIDQETLAGMEYAADALEIRLCVVLGDQRNDALELVAQGENPANSQAIAQLQETMAPSMEAARGEGLSGKELLQRAAREHVHQCRSAILRRSPLLARLHATGRFDIVPAHYDAESGKVEWLTPRPDATSARADDQKFRKPRLRGMPPHVALRMLQAGHHRFLSPGEATGNITEQHRRDLLNLPAAFAIIVTTADSRVVPEHIFDSGLGDLCVLRLPGTCYSDAAQASIEHAVARTGASLCLVLGQENCEVMQMAMTAKARTKDLPANLHRLVGRLQASVAQTTQQHPDKTEALSMAVRRTALDFVQTLRNRSPYLRQQEQAGRFAMLSATYDPASGEIHWLKDTMPALSVAHTATPPTGHHAAPLAETRSDRHAKDTVPHHAKSPGSHGDADAHGSHGSHDDKHEDAGKHEDRHAHDDRGGEHHNAHDGHDAHDGHAKNDHPGSHGPDHAEHAAAAKTAKKPGKALDQGFLFTLMAAALISLSAMIALALVRGRRQQPATEAVD